ncbi:transglutaminase domain-containing protein [Paenibacillus flagellatus]|uniref:Transglutaminase n=1 Tax=Paenibacillus flagellatus TaxID=2211139 RepID=A0A2V5JV25_9BACL|nr:transglutaminase-like domain-containing protein [Paenibacillus flagellatus]PYI50565.1 transglutaminase [Paenibacillus flagellatus]
MRKWLLAAVAFFLIPLFAVANANASESADWLDTANANRGTITIRYDVKPEVKTKLMVAHGSDKYTYTLTPGVSGQSFPLQMGGGDYTVTVLEQKSGTQYRVVSEAVLTVELANDASVYLGSVQNVNWNEADEAVKLAKELTKNATTDLEKVQVLYDYIIRNIRYDDALAADVPADYIPDIDRTLASGKDICYGYASLFAAMLRSVDVPAKLVMGDSDYVTAYHAWNEVYADGQWMIVDTTVDAGLLGGGDAFQMSKDAARYKAAKYY